MNKVKTTSYLLNSTGVVILLVIFILPISLEAKTIIKNDVMANANTGNKNAEAGEMIEAGGAKASILIENKINNSSTPEVIIEIESNEGEELSFEKNQEIIIEEDKIIVKNEVVTDSALEDKDPNNFKISSVNIDGEQIITPQNEKINKENLKILESLSWWQEFMLWITNLINRLFT